MEGGGGNAPSLLYFRGSMRLIFMRMAAVGRGDEAGWGAAAGAVTGGGAAARRWATFPPRK